MATSPPSLASARSRTWHPRTPAASRRSLRRERPAACPRSLRREREARPRRAAHQQCQVWDRMLRHTLAHPRLRRPSNVSSVHVVISRRLRVRRLLALARCPPLRKGLRCAGTRGARARASRARTSATFSRLTPQHRWALITLPQTHFDCFCFPRFAAHLPRDPNPLPMGICVWVTRANRAPRIS